MSAENALARTDPEMAALIDQARITQGDSLAMIPSVNHSSLAVQKAVGSSTDHYYSEGYPPVREEGKLRGGRYYEGQDIPNAIELLVKARAQALFDVPHVNVQSLSGSPANLESYAGIFLDRLGTENKGKIMGLDLPSGGHLTHGAPVSFTSKFFDAIPYSTTPEGWIDYDALDEQAQATKPDIIVAGTTAYSRLLNWERFRDIADRSGALLLADISHIAGLIVGGAYPSPVEFADVVTTTTHKTLRGPRAAMVMVTQRGLEKDPYLGERIDKSVFPGFQGGPHINAIAGIGVALHEASQPAFKEYARQVVKNAAVLAAELQARGIKLVTGGTDSHLFLIDLRGNNDITGNTVAEGLARAGIILNRNSVPHDTGSNKYPSGIRAGTPAITSRGMEEAEMLQIAEWISRSIHGFSERKVELGMSRKDETAKIANREMITANRFVHEIREGVIDLCERFPIPDTYIETAS